MQVVGIDLLQHLILPDITGGCPLAAQFKLITLKQPLPHSIAIGSTHKVTTARGIVLCCGSWTEIVVNHVGAIIAVAALVVLTAIDAIGFTPVEDNIVDKLVIHMAVVGTCTNAVETWRTVIAVGKQAVV